MDDGCLYMHRMFVQEVRLVTALAHMLVRPLTAYDEGDLKQALAMLLTRPPSTRIESSDESAAFAPQLLVLSAEQEYALLTAVHAPICVVSGGPGTGKTSIVVSMLRLFLQLGVDAEGIALCAPTGKAAKRLADSIHEQLVRLSGIMPLERQLLQRVPAAPNTPPIARLRTARAPVQARCASSAAPTLSLWSMKASMVDLGLMEHLVRALSPETRLVLLGDAHQLPSVEAGAVLRRSDPGRVCMGRPVASVDQR